MYICTAMNNFHTHKKQKTKIFNKSICLSNHKKQDKIIKAFPELVLEPKNVCCFVKRYCTIAREGEGRDVISLGLVIGRLRQNSNSNWGTSQNSLIVTKKTRIAALRRIVVATYQTFHSGIEFPIQESQREHGYFRTNFFVHHLFVPPHLIREELDCQLKYLISTFQITH